jgi:hypothetical protein
LAFLIAAFLFRELRVEREEYLLERYYESLIAGRVKEYTWERCWGDYRIGIAWNHWEPLPNWIGYTPETNLPVTNHLSSFTLHFSLPRFRERYIQVIALPST